MTWIDIGEAAIGEMIMDGIALVGTAVLVMALADMVEDLVGTMVALADAGVTVQVVVPGDAAVLAGTVADAVTVPAIDTLDK